MRISGAKVVGAARELTLIVVAVLIALATDRTIQSRDDAALRRQYLAELGADLQQDSIALSRAISQSVFTIGAARNLLSSIERGSVVGADTVGLIYAVETLWYAGRPEFARDTWDDLGATGNLQLLPRGIRRAVSGYYNTIESTSEGEVNWRTASFQGSDVTSHVLPQALRLAANVHYGQRWFSDVIVDAGISAEFADVAISEEEISNILTLLRGDPAIAVEIGSAEIRAQTRYAFYSALEARRAGLVAVPEEAGEDTS